MGEEKSENGGMGGGAGGLLFVRLEVKKQDELRKQGGTELSLNEKIAPL